MATAKYRVGVIGCGRMGSTIDDEVRDYIPVHLPYAHAAGYAEVPECVMVAAADVNADALKDFTNRWGLTNVYTDYREMLEKEKLDIVSITTRATERATIIRHAIDAGVRGILAEKAIATTLADADSIVDTVADTNTVLAVNCSRRWHAWFMQAEKMVRDGVIGDVQHIYGSVPGPMSHSGSHGIDVIRMFAGGHVQWVMGHTDPEAAQKDDDLAGNGYMRFDNGVTATYVSMGVNQVEFDVIGSKGRLRTYYNGVEWEFYLFGEGGKGPARHVFPRPSRFASATVNVIQDIIHCLEHGGQPRCDVIDGREALEVAIAIRESEKAGGRRTALPLEDRSLVLHSR